MPPKHNTQQVDEDYLLKGFLFRDNPTKAMKRVLKKPLSFSQPDDTRRRTIECNLTMLFQMQLYYADYWDIPTFFRVVGQDLAWNPDTTMDINARYMDAPLAYLGDDTQSRRVPVRASDNEARLCRLVDDLRLMAREGPWIITEKRARYIDAKREAWRYFHNINESLMLDNLPATPHFDDADVDWKVAPKIPGRHEARSRSRSPQHQGRGNDRERSPLNYDHKSRDVAGPGSAAIHDAIEKLKKIPAQGNVKEAYLDAAYRLEYVERDAAEQEAKAAGFKDEDEIVYEKFRAPSPNN